MLEMNSPWNANITKDTKMNSMTQYGIKVRTLRFGRDWRWVVSVSDSLIASGRKPSKALAIIAGKARAKEEDDALIARHGIPERKKGYKTA